MVVAGFRSENVASDVVRYQYRLCLHMRQISEACMHGFYSGGSGGMPPENFQIVTLLHKIFTVLTLNSYLATNKL